MRKQIKHNSDYYKVFLLRTVGNFLIFSSLFFMVKTFYNPVREEIRYFLNKQKGTKYVVAPEKTKSLTQLFKEKNVQILTPEDPDFSIVRPKVGANARVIANVDVGNEAEYLRALQGGVAQAAGSSYPDEKGHMYLFAHSTDYFWNVGTYNAVFYLLYKLEKNDEIDVFYKGHRYIYKVVGKQEVDPSQVEYLTRKTKKEFLTLQTCWPPGTTLKRLLIFATKVNQN
ncbi:MAG: sortase [Patescibacteria group bacterium]